MDLNRPARVDADRKRLLMSLIFQDDSTLNSLDLRFNDCQAEGAVVLAKILQVRIRHPNSHIAALC